MKPMAQADQAIERVRLELVTRKFMVMVLALLAVWVGIAMCLTGAPNFMEQWFSPWSRYVIGGVAFLGGLTVSLGGSMTDRHRTGWLIQVTGLTMLCLWYATMAVSYSVLILIEGFHWVSPGEPLGPASTGRTYVPIVYAGLLIMTGTPLVTMIRLGLPPRRR